MIAMTTLESCLAWALLAGVVALVAALIHLVLRATGRTGPHRDLAQWSVHSPDALDEDIRVRAQRTRLTALKVEASVMQRDYSPPERRGEHP